MKSRLISTVLAATLLGATAPADIVVFPSGVEREGRVQPVTGDPNRIEFTTQGQVLQLRRSQVEVVEQDDAVDYAILGEQFLKRKSYPMALQMFQRSARAEPGNARAEQGLERTRALMEELQAQREREALEANSEKLREARSLINDGQFKKAEAAIASILAESPSAQQRAVAESARADLYLEWGLSRMDRLDPAGAEEYLQKVLEIEPGNARAKDALLEVWERNPSRREQVLEIYRERLAANPDDTELNKKVADLLLAMNRPAEAVEPLKKVVQSTVLRGQGYGDRLQSALRDAATRAASAGDIDAAVQNYEELLRYFPAEDPTPLVILEYEQRLASLAPGDFEARAALIQGLQDQGLQNFALREAELLLRDDPGNVDALAMLKANAVRQLGEIQTLMGRGEYFAARDSAETFVREQQRFPELVAQASDLYVRADLEAQRLVQQTREQARNLVSQGDQYLGDARRNAQMLGNEDYSDRNRTITISFKQEAITAAERAIQRYELALSIDPSVGPPMGLDVNTKLSDARRLYADLTASANPPRSIRRRSQLSDTGTDSN